MLQATVQAVWRDKEQYFLLSLRWQGSTSKQVILLPVMVEAVTEETGKRGEALRGHTTG